MVILQIEHQVPDFNGWKKAFDSDPLKRKESGVRAHRISRSKENPNYVIIDLEFDNIEETNKMHEKLLKLWEKVEGAVMINPQVRIYETVEHLEYDR